MSYNIHQHVKLLQTLVCIIDNFQTKKNINWKLQIQFLLCFIEYHDVGADGKMPLKLISQRSATST